MATDTSFTSLSAHKTHHDTTTLKETKNIANQDRNCYLPHLSGYKHKIPAPYIYNHLSGYIDKIYKYIHVRRKERARTTQTAPTATHIQNSLAHRKHTRTHHSTHEPSLHVPPCFSTKGMYLTGKPIRHVSSGPHTAQHHHVRDKKHRANEGGTHMH